MNWTYRIFDNKIVRRNHLNIFHCKSNIQYSASAVSIRSTAFAANVVDTLNIVTIACTIKMFINPRNNEQGVNMQSTDNVHLHAFR